MENNFIFLKNIESQLQSAGVLSPRVEAEILATHFGAMTRMELLTGDKKISPSAMRRIQKALPIRKKGKPLAYLTGQAYFYGHLFRVSKDTLIPRPETEILVEEALRLIPDHPPLPPQSWRIRPLAEERRRITAMQPMNILDVGTGSGCIAVSLTLQRPTCRMTALDASLKALKVARKNVEFHGLSDKIQLVHSRLFDSFEKNKEAFWDLVVSNPPYIPTEGWKTLSREVRSEPRLALDGGVRGLEVIEALLKQAPFFIKKGGHLLIEIGQGQSAVLSKILRSSRQLKDFWFVKDLNGIDRILIARVWTN